MDTLLHKHVHTQEKHLQWLTAPVLIYVHQEIWSILIPIWLVSSVSRFVPSESKKSIVTVFSELCVLFLLEVPPIASTWSEREWVVE